MRIAFISPQFGEAFGQERATEDSIRLLEKAGHTILRFEESEAQRFELRSNPFTVSAHVRKLVQRLRASKADLVHFVDQYDPRISRAVSRVFPTVLTAHTVAPTCPASHRLLRKTSVCERKSGFACLIEHHRQGCLDCLPNDLHRLNAVTHFILKKRALPHYKAVIAISRYIAKVLERDGARNVHTIYNAVDTPEIAPVPEAPARLIVTASRLVELKGIDYTLRALKRIESTSWTFWILGDGPERDRLVALVKEFGFERRVFFKGRLSQTETLRSLASATLVTQSNTGPEGFGLSVAQAQALGKPVVAFDVPALNEIVEHGKTGLLVPSNNTADFSLALLTLLNDSSKCEAYGTRGRQRVRELFSPESHLNKTLRVYESALAAAPENRSDFSNVSTSET